MLTYIQAALNGLKSEGREKEREKGCIQKKGRMRKKVIWGQLNALKTTEMTLS